MRRSFSLDIEVGQSQFCFPIFWTVGILSQGRSEYFLSVKLVYNSKTFSWDFSERNWACKNSQSKAHFGNFRLSEFWPKARKKIVLKLIILYKFVVLGEELARKNQTCSYWKHWISGSRKIKSLLAFKGKIGQSIFWTKTRKDWLFTGLLPCKVRASDWDFDGKHLACKYRKKESMNESKLMAFFGFSDYQYSDAKVKMKTFAIN